MPIVIFLTLLGAKDWEMGVDRMKFGAMITTKLDRDILQLTRNYYRVIRYGTERYFASDVRLDLERLRIFTVTQL